MTYDQFFCQATEKPSPHGYQCRLACGPDAKPEQSETLAGGTTCQSQLISIPTGLGKTAGVVLAWLYNRVGLRNPVWPRRLVYCLPMRTLVEQTEGEVTKWLEKLHGKADELGLDPQAKEQLAWLKHNSPVVLMGGEVADREWDVHPERPCILIGTQDMLLSRALNRGYGMSRYRWPMHFGLLNNDCLWVLDETQLMGPGLSTACQLEAFRNSATQGFGSLGGAGSVTWYMSATYNPAQLRTREWRNVERPKEFEFGLTKVEKEATSGVLHDRRSAVKRLELQPGLNLETAVSTEALVDSVLNRHEEMLTAIAGNPALPARTLIICNTVDRAVAIHTQLNSQKPEGCDLLLLHSRFRPPERREQMQCLKREALTGFPKGQIVVATQVIEAGVDVSSGILWSEVAPLASLVQRLGRLNRAGEFNQSAWKPLAIVVGVGVQDAQPGEKKEAREKREKDNAKRCLPYEFSKCKEAEAVLENLKGNASPASLEQIQAAVAESIPRCPYSLQRHELADFFDTDANLSLGFTDVSPFVRGLDDDTDLQVLWRDSWFQADGEEGTGTPGFTPDFQRDELCSVPISKWKYDGKAREVLSHGWIWRGKESGWLSVREAGIAPGMTILLPLNDGGYDMAAGWTGDKADNKHCSLYHPKKHSTDEEQLSSLANGWQSIAVHTGEVANELREELRLLLSAPEHKADQDALLNAVTWHDVGKNHPDWQGAVLKALQEAGITGKEAHQPFAKFSLADCPSLYNEDDKPRFSAKELARELKKLSRTFRPGIAHEVASALAFRAHEQTRLGPARDTILASLLAEYVIMSHHGRVRKVLRDEIPKFPSTAKDTNTVRGLSDGDPLPAVVIEGQALGCDILSTDCRRMGRREDGHESYTRGVLRLLEHYGPFRLAYFEALFRAADIRASIAASREHND